MGVKPIPDGYHTITPYLAGKGTAKLIEFLKQGLGAKEVFPPMVRPDGAVMHAELQIGDSIVMMGEPMGNQEPIQAALYLYVEDADALYKRAMQAGATSVAAPANQFYGDRNGSVKDPLGNTWTIATHVEDVSPEEMKKRVAAMMRGA